MPAETHQHHEPVDAAAVLDLLGALLLGSDDPDGPVADAPLGEFGVDDELAILGLWDAATEEFAERTVAEPDVNDLLAATTIGELAEAIARSLRAGDRA